METKDIYKELERLDVGPERVAAFVSSLVGGKIPAAIGKVPGYDYALRVTPTASGDFRIICNEFCGINHHTMVSRLYVK